MPWKKLCNNKVKLTLFALLGYSLFRIYTEFQLFTNDDIVDLIQAKNLKAVQVLTEKFTYTSWGVGELGEKPFEKCTEKRCFAFKQSRFLQTPLEKSDGVMVHVQNLFYMPSRRTYRRNPRQLWLFNTMEPQTLSFCSIYYNLYDLDDWFNITTTFKPDSTLLTDYKHFQNWDNIHEYSLYYQHFVDMLAKNKHFLSKKVFQTSNKKLLNKNICCFFTAK